MRIVAHDGKLFASTGEWTDLPYYKNKGDYLWTGPQILVKEKANAPWRVDTGFPSAIRVDAMFSARFLADGAGRKFSTPVDLLVASPSSKDTATWTRDAASGKWSESVVAEGLRGGMRSFCLHTDAKTGIQHLFGGSTKSGSIFCATYDASVPGKIRWDSGPELSGTGRVMCMAEANGVLYAACGINNDEPLSGGLFLRIDGASPRWELVWRWPYELKPTGDETKILRGLTAIPDPSGNGYDVLLGTCTYPGVVYRIDPKKGFSVTTELSIRDYFAHVFGVPKLRGACLSAYNNFLPATDPKTGEKVHLLGVWVNNPSKEGNAAQSAWYLIRHADGTYSHGRVFDPANPSPNPPRGLVAVRTIECSPFPEDKGTVFYFGGYDCASVNSRNTAWLYRGVLQ